MIILEKLDKPYEQVTIRTKVWYRCDYCNREFQRDKKSRERLNAIITKDSCGDKPCTRAKQEDVCLKNFGTKNIFETDQFKIKQRETNLAKYGAEEYFSSADAKEKRRATLIEHYGVDSPLRSEEIRKKHAETCLDRYGVANPSQVKEFIDKKAANNVEKYGVESPMQLEEIKEKKQKTSQDRYDKDNYTQTERYWADRKKKCLEKYGVEHESQLPEVREKHEATCLERYGVDSYFKTDAYKDKVKKTCLEKYGVPNPLCLKQNQKYGKTQEEIREWLNALGFLFESNVYDVLVTSEIDLYDRKMAVGIEYSGLFWHTELSPNPRDKNYHFTKYVKCREKNIHLITLFEDEWVKRNEQTKSLIKSKLGIFDIRLQARKCEIKILDKKSFQEFCLLNHLLGSNNLGETFVGLFHNVNLVACLSLGQHHRNRSITTVDRICFKLGTQVVGGAGRLFSTAIKIARQKNVKQIVTWSDNRWSEGDLYKQLGFKLDRELPPDYSYVDLCKPYKRISKQSQKKSNVKCPDHLTEVEWAAERGLARIWDCGKKRWVYTIPS